MLVSTTATIMAIVSLLIMYPNIIITIHIRDQHIIRHRITFPIVAIITTILIPIRHTIRPIIHNISQDLKQTIIQTIIRVAISQNLVRITHITVGKDIHMPHVAAA